MTKSSANLFFPHFDHAGWLAATVATLAFAMPVLLCRDATGAVHISIGLDIAMFAGFWGGFLLLLAGLSTPVAETALPASCEPRRFLYKRFFGLLGFWLAGIMVAGLLSAIGLYLVTGFIWTGFVGLVAGTSLSLMPFTALATILRGRLSTVSLGFFLVLLVALGSNLDLIRDAVDGTGSFLLATGFEIVAAFVPDLGFPDWRGWVVFGHYPGKTAVASALIASLGLTLFFLELGLRFCEKRSDEKKEEQNRPSVLESRL